MGYWEQIGEANLRRHRQLDAFPKGHWKRGDWLFGVLAIMFGLAFWLTMGVLIWRGLR